MREEGLERLDEVLRRSLSVKHLGVLCPMGHEGGANAPREGFRQIGGAGMVNLMALHLSSSRIDSRVVAGVHKAARFVV